MKMIRAIVRPEKSDEILNKLGEAGYRSVTKYSILGRGKQRGLKVEDVYYDEIPKDMLLLVVEDKDEEPVTKIILETAKTSESGSFGDGKIFVQAVEKAYTISSGNAEL
ncbi:MAG: P-II family nitrogen regulator [Lachnospiraceae bacterium]